MNNKQQTAVEWLASQLYEQMKGNDELFTNCLIQAKQMEKEQIIGACNQNEFQEEDNFGITENLTKGEQYYKDTYENSKN